MRELDRKPSEPPQRCAVVGAGRLGHALAAALRRAGVEVEGPLRRGEQPTAQVVLLCVPDDEIAAAAAAIDAPLVGHCSGATTLEVLGDRRGFSLHPLMTVPAGGDASFEGAGAAVAGSDAEALAIARGLATALGMRPVHVADEDRAAYHAAASLAANFLVTLEGAAERLAAPAGVERARRVPRARAARANWAEQGAEPAHTRPVARGDEATIARQRSAIAERAPDLLDTFDALVAASRVLAAA